MDPFCEGLEADYPGESRALSNAWYSTFAEIAVDGFVAAQEAYIKLEDRNSGLELLNEDAYVAVYTIKKGCVTAICFSAMALESFINMFSLRFAPPEFAKEIDRLPPAEKWQKTMEAVLKKDMEKGRAPLQLIIQCTRIRNDYVHNKPVLFSLKDLQGNIPAISFQKSFLTPAYESLQAMKASDDWIQENSGGKYPTIVNANLWTRVSDEFKRVEEYQTCSDVYTLLSDNNEDVQKP